MYGNSTWPPLWANRRTTLTAPSRDDSLLASGAVRCMSGMVRDPPSHTVYRTDNRSESPRAVVVSRQVIQGPLNVLDPFSTTPSRSTRRFSTSMHGLVMTRSSSDAAEGPSAYRSSTCTALGVLAVMVMSAVSARAWASASPATPMLSIRPNHELQDLLTRRCGAAEGSNPHS